MALDLDMVPIIQLDIGNFEYVYVILKVWVIYALNVLSIEEFIDAIYNSMS